MRIRALDYYIGNSKTEWLKYNPFFKTHIKELDESFNRGIPLDLEYYIERQNTIEEQSEKNTIYEDEMCVNLFSSNPTGKINLLVGDVGSGKTSFARYISEKKLISKIPSSISVYIDAYNIFYDNSNVEKTLERMFFSKIKTALIKGPNPFFKNNIELVIEMLKIKGFDEIIDKTILDYEKNLTIEDILDFLDNYGKITHLLIVFDNMDEDCKEVIEKCRGFAHYLISLLRDKPRLNSSILIPLREYTQNNLFTSTDRYAISSIKEVDDAEIVNAKLQQAADLISKTTKDIPTDIQGKDVVISKDSLFFLKQLTEHLLSTREPEVLDLIKGLSGGNLKILVANTYNLLHSVKLPLIPLFKKIFSPAEFSIYKTRYLLSFDLACACLMAIHYPFYDYEASHIINIFNADSKNNGPNEYQNTLIIYRIICLLSNNKEISYKKIISLFGEVGYSKTYLDLGLQKCLDFGLITSDHGIKVSQFIDETKIKGKECIDFYLEKLIFEPSYLQFVCEDVPMPTEYLVSIFDKYNLEEMPGSKEKRMLGVEKFIDFLEKEEKAEIEYIQYTLNHDILDFLDTMSFQGKKISTLMKENVPKKIERILK